MGILFATLVLIQSSPDETRAVDKGLAWLARQQNEDGSFGPARGTGERGANWIDPWCAWLFVLHAPDKPESKKGAAFLHGARLNPGELGHGGKLLDIFPQVYFTLGVAMIYSKTKDEKMLPVLKGSVEVILKRQKPIGGWNYRGDDSMNTVMTGTGLYALVLARRLGVEVPAEALDKAAAALKKAFVAEEGGFRYGVQSEGGRPSPDYARGPNVARCGAAAAALLMLEPESKEARSAVEFLHKQFEGTPWFDFHGEDPKRPGLPFHATKPLGYLHAALALGAAGGKLGPKLSESLRTHQKEDGSFELGDEFLGKVPLANLDRRQSLSRVRDTCFALVALSVFKEGALDR
jgi:hypothetical protein